MGTRTQTVPRAEMRLAETIARNAVRVQKANARFDTLTPAKKRVAIAKDVLAWVALDRLKPTFGVYLAGEAATNNSTNGSNGWDGEEKCSACAIGAMLACGTVFQSDTSRLNDDTYRSKVTDALGEYFTQEQLDEIEVAFEAKNPDADSLSLQRQSYPRAAKFAPRLRSARGRITAIMENIIANDGEFRP